MPTTRSMICTGLTTAHTTDRIINTKIVADRLVSSASLLTISSTFSILWRPAPGLGPPRPTQPQALLAKRPEQTVLPRLFPPRQPPNGVAWRFPDWKAVGSRFGSHWKAWSSINTTKPSDAPFPGPVPRIGRGSHAVADMLACPGSDAARIEGLSPRSSRHHWRRL